MTSLSKSRLINWPMLLRIIGWLLCIEAVFMLAPMATSLIYGESDWLPFACTAAATGLAGMTLARATRPRQSHLGKRDGFLLTASVWVVFSVFGLLPFVFGSSALSFSDAFFEAMSGFTTTGASVMASTGHISHGIHFWRAMMQWIGGMGIILFTLAIIPMLNHSGGMQMFNAEVTGITHDKIKPRISQTAKLLWLIYILLTVAVVLLLWAGPMSLFESVCHAFGTVSTGGYSTSDSGIAAWDATVYVKVVITVFMFISGISFALLYKVATGNFRALRESEVFRAYATVVAVMFVVFALTIYFRGCAESWASLTIDPLFQVVSIITSTGFTVSDLEAWGPFVLTLCLALMFCGACAGSTSGGAKIDRVLYLMKNTRNELDRCIHPNAILPLKVNGKVVSPELVNKVIAFLGIYVMLVSLGAAALTGCGVPLVDSYFCAFSCIGNTGLGAGITGLGGGYELLPDAAKWVLSLLMLTGRLEIFTVLVLLTPAFWRR